MPRVTNDLVAKGMALGIVWKSLIRYHLISFPEVTSQMGVSTKIMLEPFKIGLYKHKLIRKVGG